MMRAEWVRSVRWRKVFASFRQRLQCCHLSVFDPVVIARTFENGGFGPSDNGCHIAGTFKSPFVARSRSRDAASAAFKLLAGP